MTLLVQDCFIQAAHEHGQATIEGDAPATNRAYQKLVNALRELRRTPDKGESFLASLLNNDDLSVVSWAASYLLLSRQQEAVKALQKVAEEAAPLIAFGAEMTLQEWQAGRLNVE